MATSAPLRPPMMIPNSRYRYYCLGQCSATLVPQESRQQGRSGPMTMKRRELMLGLSVVPAIAIEPQPSEAREVLVGSYLPPSPSDPSFVLFKASAKDTPALRAGSFSYLSLSYFQGWIEWKEFKRPNLEWN